MSSATLSTLRELKHGDEKKLRAYFDEIIRQGPIDGNEYLHEIIKTLIEINLLCARIIDHPLFVRIRDTFVDILRKSGDDFKLFYRMGELFSQLTDHTDDKNVHLFQQLFADATTVKCLSESLKSLSPKSNPNLIGGIGNIIDAYQKFQQNRPLVQNDHILSNLTMPIVAFVNSTDYKSSFFQLLPQQNELTPFQKFILVTCPKYIVSRFCQRHQDPASAVARATLSRSPEILEKVLHFVDDWKEPVVYCVYYLIYLCQYCAGKHILSAYSAQHKRMIDYVLKIVQVEELWCLANDDSASDNLHRRASQLFCYTTLYIYTMTFLPELRDHLKERNIVPILIRLTKANFDQTQFHAYRALAAVLTEDNIKQLANPAQITTVFITYMKRSIDVSTAQLRLQNLLLSLTNLIQHDQIKAEFAKQADGLPLLIRCATEAQFDPAKVRLRALEILVSLTFNDAAKAWLQQNNLFVQYLRTLASTSHSLHLQKAASAILWRLFSKHGTTEREFQYDVMISYSHENKEICHRIHKALIADKFHVWIDHESMHGEMVEVMAEAIEQSCCVLICMSESYKKSPYCQCEAEYAFQIRRGLVPLRVQSGYKPDGWLAFLLGRRYQVDFMKMDFDTAYTRVVSEIRQSQAEKKGLSVVLSEPNVSEEATMSRGRSELFPTSHDQSNQLKSDIDQLKGDLTRKHIETRDKLSSVVSTVADLQKRVELIDSHFERINDSLNWIMKAMARVKMANEDPPLIEHKERISLPNQEQQESSEDAEHHRRSTKSITPVARPQLKQGTSTKKLASTNIKHQSNDENDT